MMTLRDMLYLSPIKKYQKFGKFPWKMTICMFLVLFTTLQVVLIVNKSTTYAYSQYTLWNALFLNHNIQGSTNPIVNSFNLFSSNHTQYYVQTSVKRYFFVNSYSVDDYEYLYENDGSKRPAKLLVEYINQKSALDKGYEIDYDLTTVDYGPFNVDPESFLNEVVSFRIEYKLKHDMNRYIETANTCFIWLITQKYDYSSHGVITASLDTSRKVCSAPAFNLFEKYNWIGLVVLLLSILSLITVCRYLTKRIYFISQLSHNNFIYTWDRLGVYEKLKFFDIWIVFTIIGNLCQLFGAFLSLYDGEVVQTTHEALIGLGCFWSWINILKFLNPTSQSYTIINTLDRSFRIIGPYLIGIIPIFMAYVFFAICAFWETGIYPDVYMGMIAAYAVVNGDSVYAFGFAEYSQNSFFGQVFYFTFVVFFICFVQNVFIAIIQEGYGSLKKNPPKDWDKSSEEEDLKSSVKESSVNKNYKKILNIDKEKSFLKPEAEEELIQKMKASSQEIASLLQSLYYLANSSSDPYIMKHFKKILKEISSILVHFN